jgi:cytochrome c556
MGHSFFTAPRALAFGAALLLGAGFALSANAQSAPGPSPARQAVDARKAVFTLVANNFRPLGEVVKGNVPFDAAEVQKRAARVAFLAQLLDETFPDASNVGEPDSKAKGEVWSDRAGFDKKLKEFQSHAATLVQVSATEKGTTDGFRAAVATVGQDCKGCHETYKIK